MSRKVFFSFDFDQDCNRAAIVRNSNVVKTKFTKNEFQDGSEWEKVKKGGENEIKKWIDNQLVGTSVTCVLIGKDTSNSKYVKYELKKSNEKGNGILGVYIHQIKNFEGKTDPKGDTIFGDIFKDKNGKLVYFHELYHTYDWIDDNGYDYFGNWVEKAATEAGR